MITSERLFFRICLWISSATILEYILLREFIDNFGPVLTKIATEKSLPGSEWVLASSQVILVSGLIGLMFGLAYADFWLTGRILRE